MFNCRNRSLSYFRTSNLKHTSVLSSVWITRIKIHHDNEIHIFLFQISVIKKPLADKLYSGWSWRKFNFSAIYFVDRAEKNLKDFKWPKYTHIFYISIFLIPLHILRGLKSRPHSSYTSVFTFIIEVTPLYHDYLHSKAVMRTYPPPTPANADTSVSSVHRLVRVCCRRHARHSKQHCLSIPEAWYT